MKYTKWNNYVGFANWVAECIFDEELELDFDAFAELACRKLEKLGIVSRDEEDWILKKEN